MVNVIGARLAVELVIISLIANDKTMSYIESRHGTARMKQFRSAFTWAAITCLLVTQPLMGKATRTGAERMLGTIMGGAMGVAAQSIIFASSSQVFEMVFSALVLGVAGYFIPRLGQFFKLEYALKLFGLTLIMVLAVDPIPDKAAEYVAFRVFGICMGVILSFLVGIIVLPQAATDAIFNNTVAAVKSLENLNNLVWVMIWHTETNSENAEQIDRFEEEVQKVGRSLTKVEECMGSAQNELLVCRFGSRRYYFPAGVFARCGHWRLPIRQVRQIVKDARQLARQMWIMYAMYHKGFGSIVEEVVSSSYPVELIPLLKDNSSQVLKDITIAFPNGDYLAQGPIEKLQIAVEAMLRVSDYRRRKLLNSLQYRQNDPLEQDGPPPAPQPQLNRQLSGNFQRQATKRLDKQASLAIRRLPSEKLGNEEVAILLQPQGSQRISLNLHDPGKFISTSGDINEEDEKPEMREFVRRLQQTSRFSDSSVLDELFEPIDELSRRLSDPPPEQLVSQASPRSLASQTIIEVPEGAEEEEEVQVQLPMLKKDGTFDFGSFHSAREAFAGLPQRLQLRIGSQVFPKRSPSKYDDNDNNDVENISFTIPTHLQKSLPLFPNNAEGFNAKAKWYSFQVLVQQHVELLAILHSDVRDILPLLPKETKFCKCCGGNRSYDAESEYTSELDSVGKARKGSMSELD